MALSIRSSTESDTFDLGGHSASNIETTIHAAFSSPFALDDMIRITFVVGAGKLGRAKYDEKAMQAVTSTLKSLDYVEDRGASCVKECGGSFKLQHDTGKNLKTVVVFPNISDVHGKEARKKTKNEEGEPLIPTNSPGYSIAVSNHSTFKNLLSNFCPTYSQKKQCLRCLDGLLQLEQAIEEKMMRGNPLDSGEQAFYDVASDLKEKIAHVKEEAGRHVDEGKLTIEEKNTLVSLNENRIKTLMNEKNSASVAEQLKKALARKEQLQSLTDDMLRMTASYPPPLRYESQINTLRKKLLPLQALEDSSKGRLLTLSETKALTGKEEIEQEIERLEEASYGWFEEEDAFRERIQQSRDKFEAKHMRTKRGGGGGKSSGRFGGGTGGGSNAPSKWILPGDKPKGSAWGPSSVGKKKLKGKGGAVFSAMMMDSSSEEENSDDEDEAVEEENKPRVVSQQQSNFLKPTKTAKSAGSVVKNNKSVTNGSIVSSSNNTQSTDVDPTQPQSKKSKSKKKKKGKSKQSSNAEEDGDETKEDVSTNTVANRKATTLSAGDSTVSNSLVDFWQSLLLPLVMALASFIVSIVTGLFTSDKAKKGGKKKRG
eukprot:g13619.t1 g13619   contig9:69881-71674(-)